MRSAYRSIIVVVCLACGIVSSAEAQVKMNGAWSGTTIAGGGTYPNTFLFFQSGSRVFGSAIANGKPGIITGTISGNQLTFRSVYKGLNYSSDAVATTDGQTMSGTFLDSQGTSGTFSAQNSQSTLMPQFVLAVPPICRLSSGNLKINMLRFFGIENATDDTSVRYTVTVRSSTTRKIISKSSALTLSGLAKGTYRVSYKASAVRAGKVLFSSTTSPVASCVVR